MPQFRLLSLTCLLIVLLACVFVAQVLTVGLEPGTEVSQVQAPPFFRPERGTVSTWPFLLSMLSEHFVHFDYFHLVFNCFTLLPLVQVEATVGSKAFCLGLVLQIYLSTSLTLYFCQGLQACFVYFGGASTFVSFGLGTLLLLVQHFGLRDQRYSQETVWYYSLSAFSLWSLLAVFAGTPLQRFSHGVSYGVGVLFGCALCDGHLRVVGVLGLAVGLGLGTVGLVGAL